MLLYFAVRFLPHNIKDGAVGLFLHHYFDDFSASYRGATCSPDKFVAMIMGKINLTRLTRGTMVNGVNHQDFLHFYLYALPPPPKDKAPDLVAVPPPHPINALLSTLLNFLKDFYSLTEIPVERLATLMDTDGAVITRRRDLTWLADDPDVAAAIKASAAARKEAHQEAESGNSQPVAKESKGPKVSVFPIVLHELLLNSRMRR